MKLAKVQIIGVRPLLINKFNIESVTALTKVKEGSAGNNPNEWKRNFFHEGNQLYLPGTYFFATLREGSKYTKVGRGSIQKSFISSIIMKTEKAMLNRNMPNDWENMTDLQMTKDSSQPVYLDIRGVMNPNSKGRNVRYRIACSPGWETEFEFSFDDTVVSANQIKKIIEDSGKFSGTGDGRSLGYGRFKIKDIILTNDED